MSLDIESVKKIYQEYIQKLEEYYEAKHSHQVEITIADAGIVCQSCQCEFTESYDPPKCDCGNATVCYRCWRSVEKWTPYNGSDLEAACKECGVKVSVDRRFPLSVKPQPPFL